MAWILGVLIGLVLGAACAVIVMKRRRALEPPPTENEPVDVLPEGLAEVVSVLRSAVIVVDAHDAVRLSTVPARNLGLVRDNHVAVDVLLELAREVRQAGEIRTTSWSCVVLNEPRPLCCRCALRPWPIWC